MFYEKREIKYEVHPILEKKEEVDIEEEEKKFKKQFQTNVIMFKV